MALQVRAQQRKTCEGVRAKRNEALRHLAHVVRRQDQVLAALAFVRSLRPGILKRHLPGVDDVAGDRSAFGRRDLDDDGPVLHVPERHEVDRVRVRRQRLVLPVDRPRPVDDLVDLGLGLRKRLLQHQVGVDRRHAPDDRLRRPALDGAALKIFRRNVLCDDTRRSGKERKRCKGNPKHVDPHFRQCPSEARNAMRRDARPHLSTAMNRWEVDLPPFRRGST
ncbi:hypothetical protein D9M68_449670 [compost metagenome]